MRQLRRRRPTRRARATALAALAVAAAAALPTPASAFVYYTTYSDNAGGSTVGRANLDGSGINNGFITGVSTDLGGVFGSSISSLAVGSRHLYWDVPSLFEPRIGRANLDGTAITRSWLGSVKASGLAIDSQWVYWPDESGFIARAKPDGSGLEPRWIDMQDTPSGIAVDAGHIYWADGRRIARANLDGTGIEYGFLDVGGVGAIAVDAGHVYWANGQSIGRANLDGSGVEPSFITGLVYAWSIAVDAGHVYWADGIADAQGSIAGGNTIGRANLDGSGVEPAFITTGIDGRTYSVAVDALSDTAPPQTTITRPLRPTLRIGRSGRTVVFRFVSSEGRSTFQCKLGKRSAFKPCTSPLSQTFARARTFVFSVRAVDALGNVDPTPATKVLRLVR